VTGRAGHSEMRVGAGTRLSGVIGDPIAHSLSPLLHNAAYRAMDLDWVSLAFQVRRGQGAAAVAACKTLRLGGLSVTMPLKAEVAAAADELTPVAARLGAVNCLAIGPDGQVVGDSTDGDGFLASCRIDLDVDPAGRRCVVVGAGGAARAVIDALAQAGAAEVVVVGRNPARLERAAALAGAVGRVGTIGDIAHADLVVQATPVGMAGAGGPDPLPFDPATLHQGQVLVDLIYHPLRTPLLQLAAQRGVRTANGLGMLVHQAAAAVERWTGLVAPVAAMAAAAAAAVTAKDVPGAPGEDDASGAAGEAGEGAAPTSTTSPTIGGPTPADRVGPP